MIRYKTAKLFELLPAWAVFSAMSARSSRISWQRMHIGTAFQLIDDVLDYSGDEADTGRILVTIVC